MSKKLTKQEFVKRSKKIHNNRYTYDWVIYVNNTTKVKICCKIHGLFKQTPHDHLSGRGCRKCSGTFKKTLEQFIADAKKIHGDRYDYSDSDYVNNTTKIKIICKNHNMFEQTPHDHLSGRGCRKCKYQLHGEQLRKKLKQFIIDARKIHGNLYDYSEVIYTNTHTKINIICKIHGVYKQSPSNHLQGHGCPSCIQKNYSKIAIIWLEKLEKELDIKIQHAENDGEYKIGKYSVDRFYNKEFELEDEHYKGIVFEFHGCYWHGCKKCYKDRDEINKIVNKNMRELYEKTINREKYLQNKGYFVYSIWECE